MAEVFEQYGPYKCIRRLGIGGMAETFLAVQRGAAGFEQRVCMKFILPGHRGNAEFKRLFMREASIAASLRHSNIVGVIDVDASVGYMVLELVDGVDLRTLLNAAPGRKLTPELATLVTVELCKALAYAHGRMRGGQADGIVHRDVSPSNVLISYAGEVKLTDFGVARAMSADVEPLSTTVKGKLCYMSPEQARGQLLDGRSDLFAVGVMFYELLCGQRPFDGNSDAETLLRVTAGQFKPLREVAPEVPPGLAHIVERLIQRDREQRTRSADACIDALVPFTPRLTSFRVLGDMAKTAQPHETLAGVDIESVDKKVFKHPQGGLSATVLHTVALPGATLPPRSDQPELREPWVEPVSRSQTTLPSVHRNAWIALGVSCTLLLFVGIAWAKYLREKGEVVVVTPSKLPEDPPKGTGGDPPKDLPTAGGMVLIPLAGAGAGAGGSPPILPIDRPHDLPDVPNNQKIARVPREKATLDVGVVPWGKVWIDGDPYGWTPVRGIKLTPGRHTVSAGIDKTPQIKKHINLKPGEQAVMTLQLDASGGE
jgi:serine/threonine protein kinase